MKGKKKKVALAMSGGVDSSVAALILQQNGYEVHGFSFRLTAIDAGGKESGAGFESAKKSADLLKIPHTVLDCRDMFHRKVVLPFIRHYLHGRTPNPCIICNRDIKFSLLARLAGERGFDHIATGHYARTGYDPSSERHFIRKALSSKDQSYFLFTLTQKQLAITCFPLGELRKDAVRKLAAQSLPHVADRGESQEVCFVPDQNYGAFIARNRGSRRLKKGFLIDEKGGNLREHQGIHLFTVGQRRGLGLAVGSPRYVTAIHSDTGDISIGSEQKLFETRMKVAGINWIALGPPVKPLDCTIKIRFRHPGGQGRLTPLTRDTALVEFLKPQRAITPGQGAAFYDGDILIGGGWIEH